MVGRKVEAFEVVIVGIDVGAELDRKSHVAEDVDDLVESLSEWMGFATEMSAAWKCGIEPFLLKTVVLLLLFEPGKAVVAVENEFFFEIVDKLAELGALIR